MISQESSQKSSSFKNEEENIEDLQIFGESIFISFNFDEIANLE